MDEQPPLHEEEITIGPITIRATVDHVNGLPHSTFTMEQLDHDGNLRPVTAVMDTRTWSDLMTLCIRAEDELWTVIKEKGYVI